MVFDGWADIFITIGVPTSCLSQSLVTSTSTNRPYRPPSGTLSGGTALRMRSRCQRFFVSLFPELRPAAVAATYDVR